MHRNGVANLSKQGVMTYQLLVCELAISKSTSLMRYEKQLTTRQCRYLIGRLLDSYLQTYMNNLTMK